MIVLFHKWKIEELKTMRFNHIIKTRGVHNSITYSKEHSHLRDVPYRFHGHTFLKYR